MPTPHRLRAITVIVVAAASLLTACSTPAADPTPGASATRAGTGEMRHDLEPLTDRFPRLTAATDATWMSGTPRRRPRPGSEHVLDRRRRHARRLRLRGPPHGDRCAADDRDSRPRPRPRGRAARRTLPAVRRPRRALLPGRVPERGVPRRRHPDRRPQQPLRIVRRRPRARRRVVTTPTTVADRQRSARATTPSKTSSAAPTRSRSLPSSARTTVTLSHGGCSVWEARRSRK